MHPAGSSFFSFPTSITYAFLLGITASHHPLPRQRDGTLSHSAPCLHPFRDIISEMKAECLDASVMQFLTAFYKSLSSGSMSLSPTASYHVRSVSAAMEERCEGGVS
ncbi:hypothetical protein LZ31DRAFT_137754 [Colletotrichum somersetense]|nr:hypothetical protein LZ31DRAFT_137754 [Colletotrichum somersetense]